MDTGARCLHHRSDFMIMSGRTGTLAHVLMQRAMGNERARYIYAVGVASIAFVLKVDRMRRCPTHLFASEWLRRGLLSACIWGVFKLWYYDPVYDKMIYHSAADFVPADLVGIGRVAAGRFAVAKQPFAPAYIATWHSRAPGQCARPGRYLASNRQRRAVP